MAVRFENLVLQNKSQDGELSTALQNPVNWSSDDRTWLCAKLLQIIPAQVCEVFFYTVNGSHLVRDAGAYHLLDARTSKTRMTANFHRAALNSLADYQEEAITRLKWYHCEATVNELDAFGVELRRLIGQAVSEGQRYADLVTNEIRYLLRERSLLVHDFREGDTDFRGFRELPISDRMSWNSLATYEAIVGPDRLLEHHLENALHVVVRDYGHPVGVIRFMNLFDRDSVSLLANASNELLEIAKEAADKCSHLLTECLRHVVGIKDPDNLKEIARLPSCCEGFPKDVQKQLSELKVTIRQAYRYIKRPRPTLVVITGDSGAGKGVLAHWLAYQSGYKDVHTMTAPMDQMMRQVGLLFGAGRGAWTGLDSDLWPPLAMTLPATKCALFIDELNLSTNDWKIFCTYLNPFLSTGEWAPLLPRSTQDRKNTQIPHKCQLQKSWLIMIAGYKGTHLEIGTKNRAYQVAVPALKDCSEEDIDRYVRWHSRLSEPTAPMTEIEIVDLVKQVKIKESDWTRRKVAQHIRDQLLTPFTLESQRDEKTDCE